MEECIRGRILHRLFNAYDRGATRRGLGFYISRPLFEKLVMEPCFYCWTEPDSIQVDSVSGAILFRNGIDRVNSYHDYRDDNCVPCCMMCNSFKRKHGFDVFVRSMKYEKIVDWQFWQRKLRDKIEKNLRFMDSIRTKPKVLVRKRS